MKLSILIATVPEREEQFLKLLHRINKLIGSKDIQIVINNKPRYDKPGGISVGEKRQELIDAAIGKYIAFVDDDDDVTDNFIEEVYPLLDKDVDVICPRVLAKIDGKDFIIDQSIYNEIEQLNHFGLTKRYPSILSVYLRDKALGAKFDSINNGEDFKWSKQLQLSNEIKVESTWFVYNYDSDKTIASKALNKCIVTFSNTPDYDAKVERLKESVKDQNIKVIHYKTYEEISCKPHSEYPYAFKPYSIQKAREAGYNCILWLDSPIVVTKPLDRVFKYIVDHGILLFDNIGWSMGSYTNDNCLAHFNITREDSFDIKMVMACAMGFDFNNKKTVEVFDTYLGYAHTNAYQGEWNNDNKTESNHPGVRGHRHDQSVISCIAHKKQVPLLHPNNTFIAYHGNEGMLPHAETLCLLSV